MAQNPDMPGVKWLKIQESQVCDYSVVREPSSAVQPCVMAHVPRRVRSFFTIRQSQVIVRDFTCGQNCGSQVLYTDP
jgi:hypothetical protein